MAPPEDKARVRRASWLPFSPLYYGDDYVLQ